MHAYCLPLWPSSWPDSPGVPPCRRRGLAVPSTEAVPYVGVFTGEFVDGKPLYRFPTIEVVGSRSSVTDAEPSELGL